MNFYIINMAISDLLYPIFLIPGAITAIHTEAWLISGPIGEALCKIFTVLSYVLKLAGVEFQNTDVNVTRKPNQKILQGPQGAGLRPPPPPVLDG